MPQYADHLWMFINGAPQEIISFRKSGGFIKRKAINTMNPTSKPLGTVRGMGAVSFVVEVPVRAGLPPWDQIEDATIVFVQRVGGAPMVTTIGAFCDGEVEKSTDAESGEQKETVTFGCLDWIEGV